jgi:hypothetical protein
VIAKGKMTKNNCNDLRQKLIEYLEAGNSYDEAFKRFKMAECDR